jgi:hypothetical protein
VFANKRGPRSRGGNLAGSFTFAAFATDAACLEEDQGQRKACIGAPMALPAAHRILQQQKALDILKAKSREAKIRGRAF